MHMKGTTKNLKRLLLPWTWPLVFLFLYFDMGMGRGDKKGHGAASAYHGHDLIYEIMEDTYLGKRLVGS